MLPGAEACQLSGCMHDMTSAHVLFGIWSQLDGVAEEGAPVFKAGLQHLRQASLYPHFHESQWQSQSHP